jgi:DNA-binding response OmpR family regulator
VNRAIALNGVDGLTRCPQPGCLSLHESWLSMTQPNPPPVVAIFNSLDDLLDALKLAFEGEGFIAVTARLAEIQSGILDLVAFVTEHKPDALVYDLPRPFEANWNFLRLLRETDSLKDLAWVITTTNKDALEAAVKKTEAIEIVIGKPYTIKEVVAAVRERLVEH